MTRVVRAVSFALLLICATVFLGVGTLAEIDPAPPIDLSTALVVIGFVTGLSEFFGLSISRFLTPGGGGA